ncbi:MAG: hypothetical protein IJI01_11390 [Butyrivibrio sp.]|jgi:hypothetical protein|uniref:hypothetical protein n=1 Tax=Butyrivibrio sp. TaxID=28121 RepID=UPI0025C3D15B|nr:hypothetical protein [Butyrivibrio sp.]MBQ6589270.1 hypothetical protein [Butyrivibrio sp.]
MDNEKMVMLTDDDMEMVTGGKNISKKASSLVMKDSSKKKAANTLQTGAKKQAGDLVDREEKTSIDGKLILGDFPGPGTMC